MNIGRPKKDIKTITTSVRLPPDTHSKIAELADRSYRSISGYIEMIIVEHITDISEKEN